MDTNDFYGDYVPRIMEHSELPPSVFNLISKTTRQSSIPVMDLFKYKRISNTELRKYLETTPTKIGMFLMNRSSVRFGARRRIVTESFKFPVFEFYDGTYHIGTRSFNIEDTFLDRNHIHDERIVDYKHGETTDIPKILEFKKDMIIDDLDPITCYHIYSRRGSLMSINKEYAKEAALDCFDQVIYQLESIPLYLYLSMCHHIADVRMSSVVVMNGSLDPGDVEHVEKGIDAIKDDLISTIRKYLESL